MIGDGDGTLTCEWGASGEHLIEHDSERVDVRAAVCGQALSLFRGEVRRRADDGPGSRQLLGVIECPGDPEVGHLHGTVVRDHDVAGFDVAVDHTGLMRNGERRSGLCGDLCGSSGEKCPLGLDDLAQRPALDQLHDHVVGRAFLAPVVDRDDVRVTQIRRRLGFTSEPCDEGLVRSEIGMQDLHRYSSVEQGVFSLVHVRHPAPCEMGNDSISIGENAILHGQRRWYRRQKLWAGS